ncbi:DUF6168 family protein [Vicingaceae bacterium]|nr:DUF6168 family protein [Vicingaceae bacterium]MDB4060793.1 DUF6168 family protein [Vicingaceae bacterium]
MINNLTSFSLCLLFVLLIVFVIHQSTLSFINVDWNLNLINESYLTNYFLVVFTYGIIVHLNDKKSQSLGFIFLGGFFLKLAVFMVFFNPVYKSDLEISTLEFTSFFIPYGICLTFETFVLIRLLNRS